MKQITIKGFIKGYHFDWMPEGEVSWGFSEYKTPMTDLREVHEQEHSFVVEVPDTINIVAAQVSALEAAKAKALADYQASVAKINERLSKLQALTCDSLPVGDVIEG